MILIFNPSQDKVKKILDTHIQPNKMGGYYKWFNLKTNSFYIGRAVYMTRRIQDYFSQNYLEKRPNKVICKSKLKYGPKNHIQVISEFFHTHAVCRTSEEFVQNEVLAINWAKPHYGNQKLNIDTGSRSLGISHPRSVVNRSILEVITLVAEDNGVLITQQPTYKELYHFETISHKFSYLSGLIDAFFNGNKSVNRAVGDKDVPELITNRFIFSITPGVYLEDVLDLILKITSLACL